MSARAGTALRIVMLALAGIFLLAAATNEPGGGDMVTWARGLLTGQEETVHTSPGDAAGSREPTAGVRD